MGCCSVAVCIHLIATISKVALCLTWILFEIAKLIDQQRSLPLRERPEFKMMIVGCDIGRDAQSMADCIDRPALASGG